MGGAEGRRYRHAGRRHAACLEDGPGRRRRLAGRGAVAGRYAYFPIPSAAERVMILEVSGHLMANFNGEPRAADPYGHGFVHFPVALRKGTNDLLLLGSPRSDAVRVRFVAPKATAQFDLSDVTAPDLIVGEATSTRPGAAGPQRHDEHA